MVALFLGQPTPAAAAYHTYTITVGTGGAPVPGVSNLFGYWDNNIGTIEDAVYQLPNGSNGTIRQTMWNSIAPSRTSESSYLYHDEMRFLLRQGGLSTADTDQFPDRIRLTNGANVVNLVPEPGEIQAFGQGIGQDYGNADADTDAQLTRIFVSGDTVTVELFYD